MSLLLNHNHKGMSLIEILGAVTISMTVASVAIISAKDSLKAGQRSAVQRELQSLNTALNNYKAAGGTIEPDASAEDAIAQLKRGVDVSDSEYAPLVDDPELTKRIGESEYNLAYDDTAGFSYIPDGEGAEFTEAGAESNNEVGNVGGYPFDTTNRQSALDALAALAGMSPDHPDYADYLEAINAAYALGTLTDEDMGAAGLADYNGTWIDANQARLQHADDALTILNEGGAWTNLSTQQRSAFADTEPDYAIMIAGADALNAMSPPTLTPERVNGYFRIGDTWSTPSIISDNGNILDINDTLNPNVWQVNRAPSGTNPMYEVYGAADPLGPSVHLGAVTAIQEDGRSYYGFAPLYDDDGEPLANATWSGVDGESSEYYNFTDDDGEVYHADLSQVTAANSEINTIYLVSNGLRIMRVISGPNR